ncbi:MAG: hypothetical protein ABSC93_04790 [Bryobacteraceae bacterium]|jgi:hypothetical protein
MAADDKGEALEIAVHAIEQVILESSPALRGQRFYVERRKIVNIAGVRHEIDIFVTVGAAKGYESTFIFECKDWKKPVNKNELIVFSKKIDLVSAQRGYFVAKKLSKDAVAQAATDPRITVLSATEHDPTNTPPPESFHITAPATVKCDTTFRVAGTPGTKRDPVEIEGKTAQIGGTDVLLTDYLNTWTEQLYEERLLLFQTADLPEGVYPMRADGQQTFGPGEFILDGKDIEHVRLSVEFGVQILRPAVISDFEVATRGRVIRLAKVTIRDFVINTAFVKTLNH